MTVEVSVIIAAYNVAAYLPRAVKSALSQEGVNLEVIVIDDSSNDETPHVLATMEDSRITTIRSERNIGAGAARNLGIAKAKGQWIAVLDGDDAFLEGRLKRLLTRARNEQADIIVDNLNVHRESDGVRFPMLDVRMLTRLNPLSPAAFIAGNSNVMRGYGLGYLKPVFRADFLHAHALFYPESIRIGEDYLLLLAALACGARCAVEPCAGYEYTARVGSTSYRLTEEAVARILAEDEALFARYSFDANARQQQSIRAHRLREAAKFQRLVALIKARDWGGAFTLIWQDPHVALHLWMPVAARLRRLLG